MDIRRCYDILDVPLEATAEEIRRQYRDLVNVWHPDQYGTNPRLREKAEKKLGEINAAFDAVMEFLGSREQSPPAGGTSRPAPGAAAFRHAGPAGNPAGYDTSDPSPPHQWAAAKPRSLFRRLLVPLMLVSIIVTCVVVVYSLGGLMRMFKGPEKQMMSTFGRLIEQIPGAEKYSDPAADKEPAGAGKEAAPPKVRRFVEIQLKNGSVVTAASYRVEGDMVIYRTASGTVGIKKSKVAQITFREMTVK